MSRISSFFLFLYLILLFSSPSYSQFLDTTWTVTHFVGESWFADPETTLGKTQNFYKGFAQGVFYSCDYEGQSKTYTSYCGKEFLENKEFRLFKKFNDTLQINENDEIYVHRVTCNGKSPKSRKVLYPFVTIKDSKKAFYLFESAIYILEY